MPDTAPVDSTELCHLIWKWTMKKWGPELSTILLLSSFVSSFSAPLQKGSFANIALVHVWQFTSLPPCLPGSGLRASRVASQCSWWWHVPSGPEGWSVDKACVVGGWWGRDGTEKKDGKWREAEPALATKLWQCVHPKAPRKCWDGSWLKNGEAAPTRRPFAPGTPVGAGAPELPGTAVNGDLREELSGDKAGVASKGLGVERMGQKEMPPKERAKR